MRRHMENLRAKIAQSEKSSRLLSTNRFVMICTDGHPLVVLASQLLKGDRLTRSDLPPGASNFPLERSRGSVFDLDGFSLEVAKIFQNSLSAGELPHPSKAEPLPLADVDAERVLDILLAPIDELHDNRVLRVGDRQCRVPPSDAHGMSNRILRGGPCGRNEIQVELRARVVNRTVRFLRQR